MVVPPIYPCKSKQLKHTGWTAVQRTDNIDYDLENSLLQIRTNSEIGSDEQLRVGLYSASGEHAGGVDLFFTSPPRYWLAFCTISRLNFLTDLPSGNDKVWKVTLNRDSGVPHLVLHCNNKEVVNKVISGEECAHPDWNKYWSKDVETIKFLPQDTASDYYRAGYPVIHDSRSNLMNFLKKNKISRKLHLLKTKLEYTVKI